MIVQNRFRSVSLAWVFAGSLAACGDNEAPEPEGPSVSGTTRGSISNVLATDNRFTVISELLSRSGLLRTLDGEGEFTVFAPTDAAFAAMPNSFISAANFVSTGNPAQLVLGERLSNEGLRAVLGAHVTNSAVSGSELMGGAELVSLAGSPIAIAVVDPTPDNATLAEQDDEFFVLNGRAQLLQTDLAPKPSNGVIHVIDTVFAPGEQLAAAGAVDQASYPGTLAELMEATPLYEPFLQALRDGEQNLLLGALNSSTDGSDDSDRTLFIPSYDFPTFDPAADPGDISAAANFTFLHLFRGQLESSAVAAAATVDNAFSARFAVSSEDEVVSVGGSAIVAADIVASNGRIHLLGAPLSVPASSAADILTTRSEFSLLVDALLESDAELLETLRDGSTSRTVFAPPNGAFGKFGDLVDGLEIELAADGTESQDLLRYHVSADGISEELGIPNPMDPMDETPPLPASIVTLFGGEEVVVSEFGGTGSVALNGLLEVLATDTIDITPEDPDDSAFIVVHTVGNVLIPPSSSGFPVVPPEEGVFPGTSADALAYYSRLSSYSDLTASGESTVPFTIAEVPPDEGEMESEATTITFGGIVTDILRFDPNDASLVAMLEGEDDERELFPGELVFPYAYDSDGDGMNDTNLTRDELPETTVFVPANSMFPADIAEFIFQADTMGFASSAVAGYHVVVGAMMASELTSGSLATLTVDGETGNFGQFSVDVAVSGDVTLNDGQATVIFPDIVTQNGVIHVIDNTLSP